MSSVLSLWSKTFTFPLLSEKKYSITLGKSVPLLSMASVFNNNNVFSAFALGKESVNTFQASNKSIMDFLLMFLELNNSTKSYFLPLNSLFLKILNFSLESSIG